MESADSNKNKLHLTITENPDGSYTIGEPRLALDKTGELVVEKGTLAERIENCGRLLRFVNNLTKATNVEMDEIGQELQVLENAMRN